MAVSDAHLKQLVDKGDLNIDPYNASRVTPAGYDLGATESITLNPGDQKLVATYERIGLPRNLLGLLHLRSSFVREGLIAGLALVDPGFRGQLTVSLINAGKASVKIAKGEPFLQLTLVELTSDAQIPYVGRYQESIGIVKSKRNA
jgi:dCTP deaminase